MSKKANPLLDEFDIFEFADMPHIVENGIAYQASAQGLLRSTAAVAATAAPPPNAAAPQTAPEIELYHESASELQNG